MEKISWLAVWILGIGCFVAPASFAQVTLDEVVCRALDCHPQLKVARSEIAVAQARLIDAGKIDNPVLEFAARSQAKVGADREGSMFIGYSQKFPVTDKLRRRRDLGIAEVRLACAEVHEVERNFIAEVQTAYIESVGARALITEMQRIEKSIEKSIESARNQLALAQGSELDVASAETEKVLAAQDRVLAEGRYRQALAKLRPMLLCRSEEKIQLGQDLDDVVATLQSTVRSSVPDHLQRSDVTAAEVKIARAHTDEQLAQSEALEDWELTAGYEAERSVDEPVGAGRERFIGMGVKIPIPVHKQGDGRIAEARAESEKAHFQLQTAKAQSLGEVEVALAEVKAAEKTLASFSDLVLPQLKQRESKTWDAYQQGLLEFSQVILLQQQQTRTRQAMTQAKLEKAQALARLQHVLGSNPHLCDYNESSCQLYKPGTEPANEPWVLKETEVAKKIHAMPVINKSNQPAAKASPVVKKPFRKFLQKLGGKK